MIRQEDYSEMKAIWLSSGWKTISIKDGLISFEYEEGPITDPVSIDWYKGTAFLDALKKHFPEALL